MEDFIYNLPEATLYNDFFARMFNDSHVLIGGTNGSGKSVLIDNIIYYYLTNFSYGAGATHRANFVLIDPKRVSLYKYIDLPQTMYYASENDEIIETLNIMIRIMMHRYDEMREKSIVQYDGSWIVIIIDELADLMTTCKKQVMPLLQRIAQLGRAANIKIIAATQAPNRKVIPAELILNFTGRVALRCLSSIESKQIVNTAGAEVLPKYGECIYLNSNGVYSRENIEMIADEEIRRVTNFITAQIKGDARGRHEKHERRNTAGTTAADENKSWLIATFCGFVVFIFLVYKLIWI